MALLIPASYAEWRHCITDICGLPLTETFVRERLAALDNPNDPMTANSSSYTVIPTGNRPAPGFCRHWRRGT
ncbi:MAG: hypothetical protein VX793_11815 [Pseudomonadota bacterium]|nr:hypothetical protein [Pseudomonadota bacterium]